MGIFASSKSSSVSCTLSLRIFATFSDAIPGRAQVSGGTLTPGQAIVFFFSFSFLARFPEKP